MGTAFGMFYGDLHLFIVIMILFVMPTFSYKIELL